MSDEHQGQNEPGRGPAEKAARSVTDHTEQPTIEDTDEMFGSDAEAEAAADHAGGVGAPTGVASEGRARATEADDERVGARGTNHETFGAQETNTETLGARGGDANDAASKDPADWVTGDEPMTAAQASYLDTLAREAGEELPADLTKAQASVEIDRLQTDTGRTS
jgi:hypothetical protein